MRITTVASSPIDQFKITELQPIKPLGFDISFTNSSLFMVLTVVAGSLLLMLATRQRSLIPGRLQSIAEICYEFVADTLKEAAGSEGNAFFPVSFLTLFVYFNC